MTATHTHGTHGMATTIDASTTAAQYLVFRVSDLDVAVALRQVNEILEHGSIALAPGAPPYVRGVIQARGRLLPVIDMAIKLGRQPLPPTARACIIVIEIDVEGLSLPLGLVADSVDTLIDVAVAQIEAPPLFGAGIEVAFLEGFIRHKDGMLPLIDTLKVFSNEELLRAALSEQRARTQLMEQAAAAQASDVLIAADTSAAGAHMPGASLTVASPKVEMEIWDD